MPDTSAHWLACAMAEYRAEQAAYDLFEEHEHIPSLARQFTARRLWHYANRQKDLANAVGCAARGL